MDGFLLCAGSLFSQLILHIGSLFDLTLCRSLHAVIISVTLYVCLPLCMQKMPFQLRYPLLWDLIVTLSYLAHGSLSFKGRAWYIHPIPFFFIFPLRTANTNCHFAFITIFLIFVNLCFPSILFNFSRQRV